MLQKSKFDWTLTRSPRAQTGTLVHLLFNRFEHLIVRRYGGQLFPGVDRDRELHPGAVEGRPATEHGTMSSLTSNK